jgi:hypothetical protein
VQVAARVEPQGTRVWPGTLSTIHRHARTADRLRDNRKFTLTPCEPRAPFLLDPVLEVAQEAGRDGSLVEARRVRALAHHVNGDADLRCRAGGRSKAVGG